MTSDRQTPASEVTTSTVSDGPPSPGPATQARPHFPGLEGLRAIAAGLVVLTHATFIAGDERSGWLAQPGRFGDAGVAIFFTLSGFLLYRPFAVDHRAGRRQMPSLGFWWRRVLRIFPCYWAALTILWGIHSFKPFGFQMGFDLGPEWWKYYLLLQIYIPRLGQGGIAQSWSIATEISFYLLLPLWALLIRGLSRRRATPFWLEMGGVAFLFVFGYLSRWWFSHYTALAVPRFPELGLPDGVTWRAVSFTWLPNQIDFFAIGMALAVVSAWATGRGALDRLARWTRFPSLWWLAALGVYLVITYGLADNTGDYKSAYWQTRSLLYGLLGFTMLVPLVFGDQTRGAVRRFVAWKPMWWAGVVSYGFYLWHLSLMERLVTMPAPDGGPAVWTGVFGWRLSHANVYGLFVLGTAAGLAVAAVSWYALERPLLRFKGLVGGRRALRLEDRPDMTDVDDSGTAGSSDRRIGRRGGVDDGATPSPGSAPDSR